MLTIAFVLALAMPTQLTATPLDIDGTPLTGRVVTYQSSDPAIASVTSGGLVTRVAAGSAVITATCEGKTDTCDVTVTSGAPTTPAQLLSQFNALGPAQIGAYLEDGFGQSAYVKANGDGTLPEPSTNSPTGYWLTRWDDAVTPGNGKHGRPSPESLNGAPCTAAGRLCGQGLEWPASTGLSQGLTDAFDQTSQEPGMPTGLHRILGDLSRGIQIGCFSRPYYNSFPLFMGGGAEATVVSGDYGVPSGGFEPLAESTGVTGYTDGTSIVQNAFCQVRLLNDPFTYKSVYWQWVGRDLPVLIQGETDPCNSRRIRFNVAGGLPYSGENGANFLIYAMQGTANPAQMKLLHDYAETRSWGGDVWNDTRRLGGIVGDSFFDIGNSLVTRVSRGYNGAPHVPNFTMFNLAKGGDSFIKMQWAYLRRIIGSCDFSKRPANGVVLLVSEWLNAGTLAQVYGVADYAATIDPKVVVIIHDETYNTNANLAVGLTNAADVRANFASHSSGMVDYESDRAYQNYFGDGTTNPVTGQNPMIWASQHPTQLWQDKRYAWTRSAFLQGLGEDDSARTFKIDPSTNAVALSAGSPTATPTWTPKSRTGTTLSKTLTFASKLANGSAGTAIATVNASSGLITRVAAGQCAIQAVSDDGAADFTIVNVT